MAKILENVPRNARVATPHKVQISMSKEEAGLLFGRLSRYAPQHASGTEAACRAITVRLTAPQGAFTLQALTPETQWLLQPLRQRTLRNLGLDGNSERQRTPRFEGLDFRARDGRERARAATALPDQTIKVRVRGNFRLAFGRFVRAVSLCLSEAA